MVSDRIRGAPTRFEYAMSSRPVAMARPAGAPATAYNTQLPQPQQQAAPAPSLTKKPSMLERAGSFFSGKEAAPAADVENPATSMMMAVIPDGVVPGGVFNISTPSGSLMAVTCPPTSKPGDQIQIAVPVAPVAPVASYISALELALEKEDLVKLGKAKGNTCGDSTFFGANLGWEAEFPVTGGSGTQIGRVRFSTDHVLKKPCTVELVSPGGEVLLSYTTMLEDTVVSVQLDGRDYASCATRSETQAGFVESHVRVTRADGSGGTIVSPIDSGCGSDRCMLLTFGLILFIFVIGLFLICAAYAIPVTGRVRSLDGTAEYAPHGDSMGGKTVNFVADPKDKKRDAYRPYDGKTRVDALVAIVIGRVTSDLCDTQNQGGP